MPIASPLSALPALGPKPWPCWRGSSTGRGVIFQPMTKRQAVQLWHQARRFERATRRPGRQDGVIGRNGLAVLHALVFDFIDYASGKLFPSHKGIARKAGISERSVRRGLAALRAAGVVNWLRRCAEAWSGGRFTLRQETNAYAVLPAGQWRGYAVACPQDRDPPPPAAGTWGDHPPLPQPLDQAAQLRRSGASLATQLQALEADPADSLANALARLGRRILPPRLL